MEEKPENVNEVVKVQEQEQEDAKTDKIVTNVKEETKMEEEIILTKIDEIQHTAIIEKEIEIEIKEVIKVDEQITMTNSEEIQHTTIDEKADQRLALIKAHRAARIKALEEQKNILR